MAATTYSLETWFVSGRCVRILCIKETMMMMMMMIIIISIIIIIIIIHCSPVDTTQTRSWLRLNSTTMLRSRP
jgi:hypothetical protein